MFAVATTVLSTCSWTAGLLSNTSTTAPDYGSDVLRLVGGTARDHHRRKLQATGSAIGIISGPLIDKTGVKQQVRLPFVVVPGIGHNLSRFRAQRSRELQLSSP